MTLSRTDRRRRLRRRCGIGALLAGLLVLLGLAAPALHLIDSQSLRLFESDRKHPAVAAVYISGDMGLRFGLGSKVVPAQTVYFRSDPTGILYHGTPDARPAAAMRTLNWAPVLCIYGRDEEESLCPMLRGSHAQVVGLPGGHFLHHDDQLVIATILATLRMADRTILR